MNRRKLLILLAVLTAAVLITVGVASAYLTDVEVIDNVITIGNIKLTLDEGGYVDKQTLVPGSRLEKAPKLTNEGNKDIYVFMKVVVPKGEVTLLWEENETDAGGGVTNLKKGTPRTNPAKQLQELFRFLADASMQVNESPVSLETAKVPASELPNNGDPSYDVDFTYHNPPETPAGEGWVLLSAAPDPTPGGTLDPAVTYTDVFIFGYNKKLAPTEATLTLFDEVQLKSFIEGEVQSESNVDFFVIGVYGYGIQADNLGLSLAGPYLTEPELRSIWAKIDAQVNPAAP